MKRKLEQIVWIGLTVFIVICTCLALYQTYRDNSFKNSKCREICPNPINCLRPGNGDLILVECPSDAGIDADSVYRVKVIK